MCPEAPQRGTLVLVPVPIDPEAGMASVLGMDALARIRRLRHFIAENARTARRFLGPVLEAPIREVSFAELSEHTPESSLAGLLEPLLAGHDCGLVSEAGCPAVADPGASLVARAHGLGIPVVPLPGPSAILLALMASGLDGQSFRFAGYLPQDAAGRAARLSALEADSARRRESVWFIETPYRNRALWSTLMECLHEDTLLAVSVGLGADGATSLTFSVAQWRCREAPHLERRPAVFGLQAARISAGARPRPRRT